MPKLIDGTNTAYKSNPYFGEAEVFKVGGRTITVEPYGGPAVFATDRNVWDRQPGEHSKLWAMFKCYRDMDPCDRSYNRAWIKYMTSIGKADSFGATPYQVPEWYAQASTQFRWDDRVRAFDAHIDEMTQEALLRQRMRATVETAELGRSLRMKAADAAKVLQATTTQMVVKPGGKQVRVMRSALTPSAIAKLAKVGAELERLALGMEQGGRGIQVDVTVNTAVVQADDIELVKRAEEVLRARRELALVAGGDANG